ncbi:MAG: hypothetical protein AAGH41_09645 [Pseudomonadota bacterium]
MSSKIKALWAFLLVLICSYAGTGAANSIIDFESQPLGTLGTLPGVEITSNVDGFPLGIDNFYETTSGGQYLTVLDGGAALCSRWRRNYIHAI